MWRCEVAGLSLLIDPVCSPTHHDGLFSVHPRRRFDLDGLDDGVIVVSHRHPDHFDPDTLAGLAARRPDRLLLTADPLVAEVGLRLGLRHARVLPPMQAVDLGGAALLPTPSRAPVREWGMMVASEGGLTWNQVDAALGGPEEVRRVLGEAAGLGLRGPVDLLLARWCPIHHTAGLDGGGSAFPYAAYAAEIERIAAVGARTVVPAAASTRYAGEHWLNRFAYPVDEARALLDLRARLPGAQVERAAVGRRFVVDRGVAVEDVAGPVAAEDGADPRAWRPLDAEPLTDDRPVTGARVERVRAWIEGSLRPSLDRWAWERPVGLRLEVLHGEERAVYAWRVDADGVREGDPEAWDALVVVGGGALDEVITGRSPWGRAMLSGQLRAVQRGYRVSEKGMRRMQIPAVFLYVALPYEAAFQRWLAGRLAALPGGARVIPARTRLAHD